MDENSNNVQVIFTFKLSNIILLKSSVSRLLWSDVLFCFSFTNNACETFWKCNAWKCGS